MSRTRFQEVTAMPAPSAHISFRERTGSLRAALMLLLLVAATAATSPAQTFKTLYNFCSKKNPYGVCLDGQNPFNTPLVQGANGDLYGTTTSGGTNNYGTVFKVTTAGELTTIYNFCSQPSCTDGNYPNGGLLLATDGSFYGVTNQGGAYNYGTVFKITAAGELTTLYNFCSQASCTDGEYPQAGLIQASNGNFYGTTYVGGAYSQGTAFEMTPSGTLTTLYSFCAGYQCADGGDMTSGLIQAADGNFYGTAYSGGGSDCSPYSGGGTFFRLTSSGTLTTLAAFCQPNGFYPNSALVQAANENFYGTTAAGGNGTNTGYGTFYEMTPTGSQTSLHSFCLQTGCPDGQDPQALILAPDGNFYGTTWYGGANSGTGTVFEITSTGQLTTLHTFTGTDGINPNGALLLDTNGTFYGTTFDGGENDNAGTVFSLATTPGIYSPVNLSTLTGNSVTFWWAAYPGATAYWLDVGKEPGGNDYFQSGSLSASTFSQTVNSLPSDGSPVYATWYYLLGGTWVSTGYSYTAFGAGSQKGAITSPAPSTTLTGSTVTFTWTAGAGATAYWIDAGSSAGGNQYFQSGNLGNVLTTTVNGLPTNGSTVYVTLYSLVDGQWLNNQYTYTAYNVGSGLAAMQTPTNGSTLHGNVQTFTWSAGSGATAYWMDVGSTQYGNDIYQSGNLGASLTTTVYSLPANNSTVYVTLWSLVGNQWYYNEYNYISGP
jgi:uncharacterized repeat protein (TIGR03803 family)